MNELLKYNHRKNVKREDAIHEEKNVFVADGRSGTDQQHDAYRLRCRLW